MTSAESNIDVLVVSSSRRSFNLSLIDKLCQVGAGPVGLVAALVLAQNGVSIRIVDKLDNFDDIGQRGAGIQVRLASILTKCALSVTSSCSRGRWKCTTFWAC